MRLVAAAVEERERGVVHACKDHFGFLKCEAREGQVFFHFAAVQSAPGGGGGGGARSAPPVAGDEFDFVLGVDERTGKPCATKLRRCRAAACSSRRA